MKTLVAFLVALLGFFALSGCVVVPAYDPAPRAYYGYGYYDGGPYYSGGYRYRRGYY